MSSAIEPLALCFYGVPIYTSFYLRFYRNGDKCRLQRPQPTVPTRVTVIVSGSQRRGNPGRRLFIADLPVPIYDPRSPRAAGIWCDGRISPIRLIGPKIFPKRSSPSASLSRFASTLVVWWT